MTLIAMFGSFAIGVVYEVLPDCNPLIDGCRSISATGRQPPGSFLFRAIMLPQGIILGFVWYLSVLWLQELRPALSRSRSLSILIAGLVNVVALIIYVTFLGTSEPIYEFMRRTGIYLAFAGGAFAQLFVALALLRTNLRGIAKAMLSINVLVLTIGILNLLLKEILADPDPMENRLEWIATILLQAWFFLLFAAWRRTAASFAVTTRTNS
ncbi:MAG: hypothetical protein GTO71_04640 [Woeseiaceae bacterium]|nr:hypothetical protein [Woeseiaceae bacterium]NIP20385.1 hypothetical protein [Woeseiaceae bacterium]